MSDTFCRDCNSLTEVVFDHRAGDAICSECGLVLEAHTVDDTAEWRSFADDSNDNDPNRVGGPVNPLLSEAGLSTVIARPRNGGSSSEALPSSVGKWQGRASKPDRHLLDVFGAIAVMADRLGLVTTIKDRANEIYKKVEDQKPLRGRNQDAVVAACLYIACRQENKARTMKEICTAVSGATKKEIGRAKEFILKHLEAELGQEMGTIHAGDYLRRFCSNLGMKNRDVKAAQEMVQNIEELVIRRSPISVAAAVTYTINQLSDEKMSLFRPDFTLSVRAIKAVDEHGSQPLDDRIVEIIIIERYIVVLIMILSFNGELSFYYACTTVEIDDLWCWCRQIIKIDDGVSVHAL